MSKVSFEEFGKYCVAHNQTSFAYCSEEQQIKWGNAQIQFEIYFDHVTVREYTRRVKFWSQSASICFNNVVSIDACVDPYTGWTIFEFTCGTCDKTEGVYRIIALK